MQVRLRKEWERTQAAAGAAASLLQEELDKRLQAGAPLPACVPASHFLALP